MLSYQHIYHAGNFADVHKHAALVLWLRALCLKGAPLTLVDTHAGRGRYDLQSREAQKTAEYDYGIMAFTGDDVPLPLKHYIDHIRAENTGSGAPRYYPGSALIAARMLRRTDRLFACEKHPGEVKHLQSALAAFPHASPLPEDGPQHLLAVAGHKPAQPLRLAAFIDPSYEIKSEYADMADILGRVLRLQPQAALMLWYPVMVDSRHKTLLEKIARCLPSGTEARVHEINLNALPAPHYHMSGSGLVFINPPWPMAVLNGAMDAICRQLPGGATVSQSTINP